MNHIAFHRDFYENLKGRYDASYVYEGDEHFNALRLMFMFLASLDIKSILDVGCGTGRGIKYLLDRDPEVTVYGLDPSRAQLRQAIQKGIGHFALVEGCGETLPFATGSFDAVCELGILHHIPKPESVVKEMLRLARKAVLISDSNRFGQGSTTLRVLKFIAWKAGLWPILDMLKTKGRGYCISDFDGLSYSYSVYDSLGLVAEWADEVHFFSTAPPRSHSPFHPLFTSRAILMCGIRW